MQVCFKHPDLLKKAREACWAKREEDKASAEAARRTAGYRSSIDEDSRAAQGSSSGRGSRGGGRGYRGRGRPRGRRGRGARGGSRGRGTARSWAIDEEDTGGEYFVKPSVKHLKIFLLLLAIDDSDEDEEPPPKKMMKIKFGTMLDLDGKKILVGGRRGDDEDDSDTDDSKDPKWVPPAKAKRQKEDNRLPRMAKLQFNLGSSDGAANSAATGRVQDGGDQSDGGPNHREEEEEETSDEEERMEEEQERLESKKPNKRRKPTGEGSSSRLNSAGESDDEADSSDEGDSSSSSSEEEEEDDSIADASDQERPSSGIGKLFKIEYEDYERKVLGCAVRRLARRRARGFLRRRGEDSGTNAPSSSSSNLLDVRLVCRGGRWVCASGLLLAAASPLMRSALAAAPRIDAVRTVLMPDLSARAVETFLRCVVPYFFLLFQGI